MDWLGVARNELSAKITAAKAETLLEVAHVDARVAGLGTTLSHVQASVDRVDGALSRVQTSVDAVGAGVGYVKLDLERLETGLRGLAGASEDLAEMGRRTQQTLEEVIKSLNEIAHEVGREDAVVTIDLTGQQPAPSASRQNR